MNNTSAHEQETPNEEILVSAKQAAEDLQISTRTLANWRSMGRPHIKYTRVGSCIRYYKSAINAYLAKNTVHGAED